MYLALHQCASCVNTVQSPSSTTSRKHFQAGCLTKGFKRQAECTLLVTIVLQVLPLCKVCLVMSRKHLQVVRLTKLFKHQAWCTLLFTNVLHVLTLCKVRLVQRVGNIFNMAA